MQTEYWLHSLFGSVRLDYFRQFRSYRSVFCVFQVQFFYFPVFANFKTTSVRKERQTFFLRRENKQHCYVNAVSFKCVKVRLFNVEKISSLLEHNHLSRPGFHNPNLSAYRIAAEKQSSSLTSLIFLLHIKNILQCFKCSLYCRFKFLR